MPSRDLKEAGALSTESPCRSVRGATHFMSAFAKPTFVRPILASFVFFDRGERSFTFGKSWKVSSVMSASPATDATDVSLGEFSSSIIRTPG